MVSLSLKLAVSVGLGIVVIAFVIGGLMVLRRMRRRVKMEQFHKQWLAVQRRCAKSETWSLAVLDADRLIDDALKVAGYRGKSMGERLVAAQRELTDNDGLWFAHKLSNKLASQEMTRLYKKDVQTALRGYRQALRDIGVLE